MNTQYQQDALDVMKELCNILTSNTAKPCQQTAAMQNEVSVQTGYTQQCVVINDLFRMTGDENYSLYNIMLRLTVIDSLYSTNARYNHYGIEQLAVAIWNLSSERAASDYFYSIACGGKDTRKLFSSVYGIRKNLDDGNRLHSLISKYAFYAVRQDPNAYPLGFPIYDNLVVSIYGTVCKHLCIKPKMLSPFSIEKYVAALDEVRQKFFGNTTAHFCGYQQFYVLDMYMWRVGKCEKGSYSLLFSIGNYSQFVNNIGMANFSSKNDKFDDVVCDKCRQLLITTICNNIVGASDMIKVINHWKNWF